MYFKQSIGKLGEDIACLYLEKNNYKIIKRNFRCKQGELDIIAFNLKKELIFIEVKTRNNINYGFACEAVNKYKKRHIYNCAKYYLFLNNFNNINIRFDIIGNVFDNFFINIIAVHFFFFVKDGHTCFVIWQGDICDQPPFKPGTESFFQDFHILWRFI